MYRCTMYLSPRCSLFSYWNDPTQRATQAQRPPDAWHLCSMTGARQADAALFGPLTGDSAFLGGLRRIFNAAKTQKG